jgi:hypothetical protein
MGCLTDKLTANIAIDCLNLSIAGLESDVVVIPRSDFDRAASTVNATNDILLDLLACKAGSTGFILEGVKQLHSTNSEFVPSDETLDKFRHTFRGVILTPSAANRLQASKLAKGESYVVVVNKKWKGANDADAFQVLGYDAGLYITEMTEGSKDNDAAILFTLGSKDSSLENEMPRNLLITNYATTLTAFNNKFATA